MNFHARRLPHFHEVGCPIFLTWRLAGSLPTNRKFPPELTSGQAFAAMDRLLDHARTGPFYLRIPEIANLTLDSIHHRENEQYELHAYVIMPNHVHLLVTPGIPISKLTQSLKRYTAREANRILGRTGQAFWQAESYDRIVRDATEFKRIARYIEANPVKAGLVPTPEAFPYSSVGQIGNLRPIGNRP